MGLFVNLSEPACLKMQAQPSEIASSSSIKAFSVSFKVIVDME